MINSLGHNIHGTLKQAKLYAISEIKHRNTNKTLLYLPSFIIGFCKNAFCARCWRMAHTLRLSIISLVSPWATVRDEEDGRCIEESSSMSICPMLFLLPYPIDLQIYQYLAKTRRLLFKIFLLIQYLLISLKHAALLIWEKSQR